MSERTKAVQARISGRVQGVGFRDWTRREATGLGLTGWVRNEPDGSVSAMLVGSENAVATMLERLRTGPRFAAVSDVASQSVTVADLPADFRVTR